MTLLYQQSLERSLNHLITAFCLGQHAYVWDAKQTSAAFTFSGRSQRCFQAFLCTSPGDACISKATIILRSGIFSSRSLKQSLQAVGVQTKGLYLEVYVSACRDVIGKIYNSCTVMVHHHKSSSGGELLFWGWRDWEALEGMTCSYNADNSERQRDL